MHQLQWQYRPVRACSCCRSCLASVVDFMIQIRGRWVHGSCRHGCQRLLQAKSMHTANTNGSTDLSLHFSCCCCCLASVITRSPSWLGWVGGWQLQAWLSRVPAGRQHAHSLVHKSILILIPRFVDRNPSPALLRMAVQTSQATAAVDEAALPV